MYFPEVGFFADDDALNQASLSDGAQRALVEVHETNVHIAVAGDEISRPRNPQKRAAVREKLNATFRENFA